MTSGNPSAPAGAFKALGLSVFVIGGTVAWIGVQLDELGKGQSTTVMGMVLIFLGLVFFCYGLIVAGRSR